jgi:hypothetical protein
LGADLKVTFLAFFHEPVKLAAFNMCAARKHCSRELCSRPVSFLGKMVAAELSPSQLQIRANLIVRDLYVTPDKVAGIRNGTNAAQKRKPGKNSNAD